MENHCGITWIRGMKLMYSFFLNLSYLQLNLVYCHRRSSSQSLMTSQSHGNIYWQTCIYFMFMSFIYPPIHLQSSCCKARPPTDHPLCSPGPTSMHSSIVNPVDCMQLRRIIFTPAEGPIHRRPPEHSIWTNNLFTVNITAAGHTSDLQYTPTA